MAKTVGGFTFIETAIEGVVIVEPTVHSDNRGFFMETYQEQAFKEGGITVDFVQDNHSMSTKGVLRGLHFQKQYSQSKLVRCIRGAVYDVAVDLRKGSKTYGQHVGVLLSEENKRQFFIPKHFAHGFLVVSDTAEFVYKVDDFYHPNDEAGLAFDDPALGIEWPITKDMTLCLSEKDRLNPPLKELQW